jgi:hypothetical protein
LVVRIDLRKLALHSYPVSNSTGSIIEVHDDLKRVYRLFLAMWSSANVQSASM